MVFSGTSFRNWLRFLSAVALACSLHSLHFCPSYLKTRNACWRKKEFQDALRGLSLLFLPYVGTTLGLFAWAVVFGLNYISTVPATTSLTAKIYGRYSVGELSGWIFFSHQIGSAVGSFTGGFLYDRFGDYTVAFHSAAVVAFAATVMVLAIRERSVLTRPPAPLTVAPAGGA